MSLRRLHTAVILAFGVATLLAAPGRADRADAVSSSTPSVDDGDVQRGKAKGKQKNGPAFCRSGAGHPVFGRQWCLEKGFGLGEARWRRVTLGDIVLGRLPRGRVEQRRLDARDITELLGDAVIDQLFDEPRRRLDRRRLRGQWRGGRDDGVLVLELMDGDEAIAELTDTDLDGDVDVILVTDLGR